MLPLKIITGQIFGVKDSIQNQYPELYDHLGETPLFLSYRHSFIGMPEYEQYLESIQLQLAEFEKREY
jgi:hypothetical protein